MSIVPRWQDHLGLELVQEKAKKQDLLVSVAMDAKAKQKEKEKEKQRDEGFRRQTETYQLSQNLRIERRSVTLEYSYNEKWTKDEWMVKSDKFEAPRPSPKWFVDSCDSDLGSLVDQDISAKVCICGDAAVGKTSFTQRYVSRVFQRTYKWTVGG